MYCMQGKNKPYESFVFTPSIYGSITLPTTFSRGFTYAQDDIIAAAIPDGRYSYCHGSPHQHAHTLS